MAVVTAVTTLALFTDTYIDWDDAFTKGLFPGGLHRHHHRLHHRGVLFLAAVRADPAALRQLRRRLRRLHRGGIKVIRFLLLIKQGLREIGA
jgi:trk system potassium uptake protein